MSCRAPASALCEEAWPDEFPLFAGGCFGAVVVKNGKIVGEGYNNVISRNDPTW
jgi:tRNA(Arg) A34 adenosine deaminase TadA